MNEKDYSWILKLKKGDKVYSVCSSHGFINAFKSALVKSINKETITLMDDEGKSCGCYYKRNGSERVDRGQWSSNYSYIANPEDEEVKKALIDFIVRKKWCKLYSKITNLATNRLSFEDQKELIPVMEAFLEQWNARQERLLNPTLTK